MRIAEGSGTGGKYLTSKPTCGFVPGNNYGWGEEMQSFCDHTVPAFAAIVLFVFVFWHQGTKLVKGDEDLVERKVTKWSVYSMTGADCLMQRWQRDLGCFGFNEGEGLESKELWSLKIQQIQHFYSFKLRDKRTKKNMNPNQDLLLILWIFRFSPN